MSDQNRQAQGRGLARILRESAPYLGVGTSLAVTVLLGLLAGHWLDGRLGTRPFFFLLGGVLGLAAAGWYFFTTVGRSKP